MAIFSVNVTAPLLHIDNTYGKHRFPMEM